MIYRNQKCMRKQASGVVSERQASVYIPYYTYILGINKCAVPLALTMVYAHLRQRTAGRYSAARRIPTAIVLSTILCTSFLHKKWKNLHASIN